MNQSGTLPAEPRSSSAKGFFGQRRARYRAFLAVASCLIIFHAPLLGAVYYGLVVDQPVKSCRFASIVVGTQECYDETARLFRAGTIDTILVVEPKPLRSVCVGAIPSSGQIAREELKSRGVPEDSIRVVPTQAVTSHEIIRQLDRVLSETPNAECLVLSSTTLSRYYRHVIDQALAKERTAKYWLRAVPPFVSEPRQWWRSLSGIKRVAQHGMRLLFVTCSGESRVDSRDPYEHLVQ